MLTPAPTLPRHPATVRGVNLVADDRDADRLKALEERIAKAKAANAPTPRADEHYSRANLAWRMVIELVAGLLIGLGIGYGLDLLFGTMPIFLVLFTLLGFAAGVQTMVRSAREVEKKLADEAAERKD
jgi:ATP synthase protein I